MEKLQVIIIAFLILLTICILASFRAETRRATVWTNKGDYHPGETGIIYGTGFQPENNVVINVTKQANGTPTSFYAQTDLNGNFTTTYQISSSVAPFYTVLATDGKNTATTTLKDCPAVSIEVSPSVDSVTAGNSETYMATATDANGNSWEVTNSVTWSISSGAGGSWCNNVYTSETAGSWTVTADNGAGVTGTACLTVTPSALAQFVFSHISGPQTAGTSFNVTITAADSYGNTVTSYSGAPNLSDTSDTINPTITSAFVNGVWTGAVTVTRSGADIITVTNAGGATGSSGLVMVNPAILDHFVFSTISGPQTAGYPFNVTVTAKDAYGNLVTSYIGTPTLVYSAGSITPSSATGGFSNGTWMDMVTVNVAGSSVTLGVNDGNGHTGTSNTFTVSHAAALSVALSPGSATITAGKSEIYTAAAFDAYGNTWNVTSLMNWSISFRAGGSWSSNVYTSETAGSWTVTGTYASTAYIANLTVDPGVLDHFIFDAVGTQTAGSAFNITVTADDLYGNLVTNYSGTPSLTYSTGSISPDIMNAFSDGVGTTSVTVTIAGLGVNITAADGTHTGTSNMFTVNVALTPTPSPTPTSSPITTAPPTPSPTSKPISSPIPTALPSPSPTSTHLPIATPTPTARPLPTSTATRTTPSTSTPISTAISTHSAPTSTQSLLGLAVFAIITIAVIILIYALLAFKRRKQKPISNLPEIADLKNTIEKIRILEAEREKLLLEIEGLRKKVKANATRKRS